MGHFIHTILSLRHPDVLVDLLKHWGWLAYIILPAIVFSETGLLVGFCLPGDSLLFIAGFVCSPAAHGVLNPFYLAPLLMVAAIIGDNLNFFLGRTTGPKIFSREDSLLFHKKHLVRTEQFYDRHGRKTIIYARFVPIVRTFAPFVAGMGRMKYPRFLSFSLIGGSAWIVSMMTLGYYLGSIKVVQDNLEKAVLLVIFISILPMLIEVIRSRRHSANESKAAAARHAPSVESPQ